MPRRVRRRGAKKRHTRPRRRAQQPSLVSSVITTLTLKNVHNKEEVYPIPLSTIVSRDNIGSDVDIMLRSYSIRIKAASGNNLNTVSANIGHSGTYVRRETSVNDGFNQQFRDKDLSSKGAVTFNLRKVQESERQFINPDVPSNFLNLRIRDPCGVIPGVTLRIYAVFHFVRRHISTSFIGAGDPAADLYADQDVAGASGPIQPPTSEQDVPFQITNASDDEVYTPPAGSVTSPIRYTTGPPGSFTVTAAGKLNSVGRFIFSPSMKTNPSELQSAYTRAGFDGTITYASR